MIATGGTGAPFASSEEAIEELRRGRMVVVVDDRDTRDEGALTIAAEFATPEAINFMAHHARGLICLCMTEERWEELELGRSMLRDESCSETAVTVSIEARDGITTGISAYDRARTIQAAIDPAMGAGDLVQPGHVFPLRAQHDGVLGHAGQTEAAVDLARLSGLTPAAVTCGILNEDGSVANAWDLVPYGELHEIKLVTVADLVGHRCRIRSECVAGHVLTGPEKRRLTGRSA